MSRLLAACFETSLTVLLPMLVVNTPRRGVQLFAYATEVGKCRLILTYQISTLGPSDA
jgi:hypothetical protein